MSFKFHKERMLQKYSTLKCFFRLRDNIEEKELQMTFVKLEKNAADIFTKLLVVNKFTKL